MKTSDIRKAGARWANMGFKTWSRNGQFVVFNEVGSNIQLYTVTDSEVISEYSCAESGKGVKITMIKQLARRAPWQVIIGKL
jgi:hypothetical protein